MSSVVNARWKHSTPLSQAVVRLDGQYGNGAIVADLTGLAYVMRGKDYDLLDLQEVQMRLAQPPSRCATRGLYESEKQCSAYRNDNKTSIRNKQC